ncbi:CRISPR-associated endonuclease Cas3'' [Aliikangiella sp. IMCC44359]|uniref:CRISPR-associated endonuclease Cas3'' n=1 Tax=Aliikangiella sp. IMCC44359 TaxID=3459125 RepID=UPI00403AE62E
MMVTFVSQCEKNALKKTRRVLDAFANRIGDNVWQTVITNEGLLAVKLLLRRTASKSTAVSCHWIRSRSRSQLVWVIGSKEKFNYQGITPVNWTTKELFMDISTNKPIKGGLYANTHLQRLDEHLFAVGYVAEKLYKTLFPDNDNNFSNACFIAGGLHDIGKIDPNFQSWVVNPKQKNFEAEDGQHIDSKFSFDKHPRHNEISVLLYHLLDIPTKSLINLENKRSIKHAIFWHHAKPFRKKNVENDFDSYSDFHMKLEKNLLNTTFSELLEKSHSLLLKVVKIDKEYRSTSESSLSDVINEEYVAIDIDTLDDAPLLPFFKSYHSKDNLIDYQKDIRTNAKNNIIRSCVISADRLVSALTNETLHSQIKNKELDEIVNNALLQESNLSSEINQCISNFPKSERTTKQHNVALELADIQSVAVLAGAAGCGKTKIALEWASLQKSKKIIWICPRVQVCQGMFDELTSDRYLPNSNVEINTGEFKFTNRWGNTTKETDYFSAEIIITTIDQILNSIISHTRVDSLIDFLNTHVVFDEFHEYVSMPVFNLLFAELIACKNINEKCAKTLLVSATPHYCYLNNVLDIDKYDIVTMPSFNLSKYQFDFITYDETIENDLNPLFKKRSDNAFVISNTAISAQKSFIRNQHEENSVLFHSKFKKSDKLKWFEEVYESFKQNGTQRYDVLRSGPIVQASLNISCGHMISEIANAEDTLQRLGRLDRFGENDKVNQFDMAIPETIEQGKGLGACGRFLARKFCLVSTKTWYKVLVAELEGKVFTLPEIYQVYESFHSTSHSKSLIEEDLNMCFKKSVEQINDKVIEPFIIPKKASKNKKRGKISKTSLRGNNRFVQMAVCEIDKTSHPIFLNQYAYEIPMDEQSEIDNLTASCDLIQGYSDSSKNLLAHMAKKHHRIMGGKKAYNDLVLINEARNAETPIYLSYTPNDLDAVGGESARHSEAIYYAICDKQSIGAISIKNLFNSTINEE